MRKDHIYRVAFKEPPIEGNDRTDFFYTSLSAIYEEFTPEQIGVRVSRLWNIGVSRGGSLRRGPLQDNARGPDE